MIRISLLKSDQVDKANELMKLWYPEREHDKNHLQKRLLNDDIYIITAEMNGKVIGGATAYGLYMVTKNSREIFICEIGMDDTHQ